MQTTTKPLTNEERQLVEAAHQAALDKLKTTTHPVKRQCLLEELTEWCALLGYPAPTQLRH
ncbi:hypothetical protein H8L32_07520 [Undibacterium sp. CY18W]|uniref:Uncharacterized protein n=1 Tax=Undibacterium hunanense TaxID=2762292 RepID=A0ABR6ZND9_9BURK|nr:hypothetical protein [Undibacterium hunanense]MBC3917319.1 hypothetical protein [Undibacterium hunanense]